MNAKIVLKSILLDTLKATVITIIPVALILAILCFSAGLTLHAVEKYGNHIASAMQF